jgi:hypothetical protein
MAWRKRTYKLPELFTINDVSNLTMRFADGDITVIKVKILRCFEDKRLGKTCFSGSILKGISQQRIEKELAYINRHFYERREIRSEEYIEPSLPTHNSSIEPAMS